MLQKITAITAKVLSDDVQQLSTTVPARGWRGQQFHFKQITCRTDYRNYSFPPKTIRDWNNLSLPPQPGPTPPSDSDSDSPRPALGSGLFHCVRACLCQNSNRLITLFPCNPPKWQAGQYFDSGHLQEEEEVLWECHKSCSCKYLLVQNVGWKQTADLCLQSHKQASILLQ